MSTIDSADESQLATASTTNPTVVEPKPDSILAARTSNIVPTPAPKPRIYYSRLDYMRRRWLKEQQPLDQFWRWWNTIYEQTVKIIPRYQQEMTDYLMYKAEQRCFKQLCK